MAREVDVRKHLGGGPLILLCNFFAFLFFIAAFCEMNFYNYDDGLLKLLLRKLSLNEVNRSCALARQGA
jgi:hypothetical protein